MKSTLASATALTFLFALSGCATSPGKRVSDLSLPHSTAVVEVTMQQPDMIVETGGYSLGEAVGTISLLGVGGLAIGQAIMVSNATAAREAIVPLQEQMSVHDLGEVFSQRITESKVAHQLSSSGSIEVNEGSGSSDWRPGSGHTLALVGGTTFTSDLKTLIVRLVLLEFAPDEDGDVEHTGLRQVYQFSWPGPGPEGGRFREHYARGWMNLGNDKLLELIERGMDTTIGMMEQHLETPDLTDRLRRVASPRGFGFPEPEAYRWRTENGLEWVLRKPDDYIINAIPIEGKDTNW
ncbi:hypothetical protein [Wenzhouxiangella sp. EGI_FJ10409]|uniref:hypothetical protein n=1 Tax=Wenzhouxiangella sp. EGI_FJ10409 TaxID=3243767 RepID=UPI0035DE3587